MFSDLVGFRMKEKGSRILGRVGVVLNLELAKACSQDTFISNLQKSPRDPNPGPILKSASDKLRKQNHILDKWVPLLGMLSVRISVDTTLVLP
jgi:hypothetical protein